MLSPHRVKLLLKRLRLRIPYNRNPMLSLFKILLTHLIKPPLNIPRQRIPPVSSFLYYFLRLRLKLQYKPEHLLHTHFFHSSYPQFAGGGKDL